MTTRMLDWLDERTGYRSLLSPISRRILPSGPGWAYTSASCLLWLFVIEIITGFFLMTTYSPSTTSAWASVHYIDQSPFGGFLRGLHYFIAQAIIILFVIHVVRVLVSAAFRAPRELIWITGLLLMPLMIVWAITGNPLSASQERVSQIEVEGSILGSTPIIGHVLQRILIGGDEVGHLTLTHLYFLHVGLMPFLVILLLAVHISQVYRHGLTARHGTADSNSSRPYWPYQSVRNMVVLTVTLGIIAVLAIRYGAPLDNPADPTLIHVPRPEWYFRSLFELRRYFTGEWEFVATVIIPSVVLIVLLAIPVIDRWFRPTASFAFRVAFIVVGLGTAGGLTFVSYARDWQDADYLESERVFAELSRRAREIADHRQIPPAGALALLRQDPKTQGPLLFKQHCVSCHSHADSSGKGIVAAEPSAPNLFGFGTPEWISGMLDPERLKSPGYFGHTKFAEGEMVTAMTDKFAGADSEEAKQKLRTELLAVSRALSAEAKLPRQLAADERDQQQITTGKALLIGDQACTDCHKFHDAGDLGSAPDLTGYGSRGWLMGIISNPQHERYYADDRNDRMPAFAVDADNPGTNLLHPDELRLLVDWLRGEWFEPPTAAAAPEATLPKAVAGR